jgi:hypothetical protein
LPGMLAVLGQEQSMNSQDVVGSWFHSRPFQISNNVLGQ